MGSSGRDEEEPASGSTKDTNREVGKSQEPQSPSTMDFVTRMLQEPFQQGLEYKITIEGRESQEDKRAQNQGLDGERGVNMDDPLDKSQEMEENQAKITLAEANSQETKRFEDPDPGERSGKEVQELHAYQHPPPEARPQEHRDRGWEDSIPREESDGQEARNEEHRYPNDPEAEIRVRQPHPHEAGDKNVRKIRQETPENKKKGMPLKFGKRSRRGRNQPGKTTEVSTGKPRGSYGGNTRDTSRSARV